MEMSRRQLIAVGVGIGAAGVPGIAAAAGTGGGSFLVRGAGVFDGRQMTGPTSVLVLRGRIVSVGDRIDAPAGTTVHLAHGRTLLPGLIDAHVHSWDEARRDALRFGVTTELEMFGDIEPLAQAKRQRRSLAYTDRADLWSAGTGVTVPGGHPTFAEIPRLTPEDDPDRFVADRLREGSDFVKVIVEHGNDAHPLPSLTSEQVKAVVRAAHRRGRMAVAHAERLRDTRTAVAAKADAVVHAVTDLPVDDATVQAMRQCGTFMVPTLSVYDCGAGADDLLQDDRVARYLSEEQIYFLNVRRPTCSPAPLRQASANVRRLRAAGIPILAGTDASMPGTAHGVSMLAELELLTRAGLSTIVALAAATSLPAYHFGLVDRGRIAPGQRADLLLVDGDPSADIRALRDLSDVWKNGHPISRTPPT